MPRHDGAPVLDHEDRPFAFVSYARLDRGRVYREVDRIEGEGYRLWIDRTDIVASDEWLRTIHEAIGKCSCFVLFASPRSASSSNVLDEVRCALANAKPVIRVSLEEFQSPILDELLGKVHALESYSKYASAYHSQLRYALTKHLGSPFVPMPAPSEGRPLASHYSAAPPDSLPKIVFFSLALLSLIVALFSVVVGIAPFLGPGEIAPHDRLVGPLVGVLGFLFAIGVALVAAVVYRKYLRTEHV